MDKVFVSTKETFLLYWWNMSVCLFVGNEESLDILDKNLTERGKEQAGGIFFRRCRLLWKIFE